MYRQKRKLEAEKFSSSIPKDRLERLVQAVDEFMEEGDFSDTAFRHSKIAAVITENHNISVSMIPWRSPKSTDNYYRISINAPLISKNNPLIQNYERAFLVNEDIDVFRFLKNPGKLFGEVDLKEGRVSGLLSEVNCHLCVTPQYFASGLFKADEIAEKITHEVAHILLYFACLTDVVTYNYAISHSLDRYLGYSDQKLKMKFIEDLGDNMGVKFNSDVVAAVKDKETLYSVLTTETAISRRSETGSYTYANHSWEKLADNFVTRMGGGSALARGLVKLDKEHGLMLRDSAYNPSTFHYISEAAKVIFAIGGVMTMGTAWSVGFSTAIATLIGASNENGEVHDRPEERLKRIELGIIDRLKDTKLSSEDRADTLQQLKVVRVINKDIKDKPTVLRFLSRIISGRYWGKGKADAKANEYMLELEKLNSNPLFAIRSQFGDY